MTNYYFSDEAIIERFDRCPTPGARVDRELLLPLPLSIRGSIDAEAHTMMNYIGGRRSDAIAAAITTWKAGGGFPFRARALAHREAENAANIDNPGPRKILPMN